jgi:GNAT superfamily N-acetyltransferase
MSTAAKRQAQTHPAIGLRLATVEDVPAITALAMTLLNESPTYNKLFPCNPDATEKYLRIAIGTGSCPHVIAVHDGRVVGVVSYSLDASFSDSKCAVLGELFAYKEYRGTPVGRALVWAVMDLAKNDGAVAMHIPIAGGHEAVPTLKNMLRKFGAEEIGVIMRKVL